MSINLSKADNKTINLTKAAPQLQNITAHLWWNVPGASYDLDLSAFLLTNTADGPKLTKDENFVFYNNLRSPEGAVTKTADERTSGVEEVYIDLQTLASDVDEVSLVVTIDKWQERGQEFGQIPEAGIKIINTDTGEELAFYDLDEQGSGTSALQIGSLFRQNGEFSFAAVGAFYQIELGDFVQGYSA